MKLMYVILTSLLFIVGCSSSHDEQKLQCNEVEFIKGFPKDISLEKMAPLPLDLAGCVEIYGIDSLLICRIPEGEYLWKVYSLHDLRFLGNLFGRGHGHNEFVESFMPDMSICTDSALFCEFWSFSNGGWYRCNLTESLRSKEIVWDREKLFQNSDLIHTNIYLDDSTFFMVRYNNYVGYIRSLCINGSIQDMDYVGNLNTLYAEEDINTLSAVRCVNRKRMMVAEGMLRLNQINLYSLNSDSSKTLCVGDYLMDVVDTDKSPKIKRHKYYGYIVSYEDYFVALYNDVSYESYFKGDGDSQLQFFTWDGKPLLCIKLPCFVTSFFISKGRYLYIFSNGGEEEMMYKYDCGELLQSII